MQIRLIALILTLASLSSVQLQSTMHDVDFEELGECLQDLRYTYQFICQRTVGRWYYDPEEKTCNQNGISGCVDLRGALSFPTESKCKSQCQIPVHMVQKDCSKPKQPGNCYAYFPRYYYKASTGECLEFVFGGCGGNLNNFPTLEDCELFCY